MKRRACNTAVNTAVNTAPMGYVRMKREDIDAEVDRAVDEDNVGWLLRR